MVDKVLENDQKDPLDQLLSLAIEVATKAHKGQMDKGGAPYILHPQAVAASQDCIEDKIVAYLHDVCEDTEITLENLEGMGFPYHIINSIRLLTKTKDIAYDDYLKTVKKDKSARNVKMADIKHNMDISRIPNPKEKDFARIEKYKRALAFLES